MADDNYADIANQSWDDIPEPQFLPNGSYRLALRNISYKPAEGEKNGRVLFFYTAKEPMDDVEVKELEALGENYDIEENDVVFTIWIEKKKDWDKVRKHLALHGVATAGRDMVETLKGAKGAEVMAYLTKTSFTKNDGTVVEQNVPSAFAPVEV